MKLKEIKNCASNKELVHLLCSWIPQGHYYLLHIYHGGTCRNPKFQIPHFNFGGLSLPDKTYYVERVELREDFEKMIHLMFVKCGISPEFVKRIWDIEANIATNHYERAEKRDPLKTYHPTTMKQLITQMGSSFTVLQDVLPKEYYDIVLNNDVLPTTFATLFETYSLKELQTWFMWKVIKSYVSSSIGELYDIYFAFYGTKLKGIKKTRPVDERAVLFTKSHLEDEFSRIYINEYADPLLHTEFPKFVKKLRGTLREKIANLEWMTDVTKEKALEKLDTMNLKVVGPKKYENYTDFFSEDYANIYAFIDIYAKWDWNVLEVERKMYKLHDADKWEMAAIDVNAYYHPYYNEIVFPAGILQPPFYSTENQYGANAGGIGAVICHEMTHGFDDSGSKYDKDGYLHNWWTKQDREQYDEVIKPMEEYFNSLEYQGTKLNGRLTQGENLADLGGLKCAIASCPDNEQRRNCIIAWGTTWRANVRDEYAKQMITVDPHSLPRFRINGILPHIPEFYELFCVKSDDKMYLDEEKRCDLWN